MNGTKDGAMMQRTDGWENGQMVGRMDECWEGLMGGGGGKDGGGKDG